MPSVDIPAEQMQAKITAARRGAEALKDDIERRREDLFDISRKLTTKSADMTLG
jgi:hypothetical protein